MPRNGATGGSVRAPLQGAPQPGRLIVSCYPGPRLKSVCAHGAPTFSSPSRAAPGRYTTPSPPPCAGGCRNLNSDACRVSLVGYLCAGLRLCQVSCSAAPDGCGASSLCGGGEKPCAYEVVARATMMAMIASSASARTQEILLRLSGNKAEAADRRLRGNQGWPSSDSDG